MFSFPVADGELRHGPVPSPYQRLAIQSGEALPAVSFAVAGRLGHVRHSYQTAAQKKSDRQAVLTDRSEFRRFRRRLPGCFRFGRNDGTLGVGLVTRWAIANKTEPVAGSNRPK